jgi:sporulation protein YlmC with PRC-barrel domain
MRLELGSPVRCTDGHLGELADVVIDPIRRRLTHLVVEPHHRHGLARLVPVELAGPQDAGPTLLLRCTVEEARRLPSVEEFAYLRLGEVPPIDQDWDIGLEQVLSMPYYRGYPGLSEVPDDLDPHVSMTYDRIPKGEVEIRRTSEVVSADGSRIGRVDGFVVDGDDRITHVVLERGHLWGRREVTVPIGAVIGVHTDSITLSLTKEQVGDLPAVAVHRWPGATRAQDSAA